MQAYHKNDTLAAQQAFQKWQVDTQNALHQHQFEQDAYRNAIDKAKTNVDEIRANLTGLASAFKDTAVLAMLNNGDVHGALSVLTGRVSLGTRANQSATRLELFHNVEMARAELAQAQRKGDPAATEQAQANLDAALQQQIDYVSPTLAHTAAGAAEQDVGKIADQKIVDFKDTNGRDPTAAEAAQIRLDVRNDVKHPASFTGPQVVTVKNPTARPTSSWRSRTARPGSGPRPTRRARRSKGLSACPRWVSRRPPTRSPSTTWRS